MLMRLGERGDSLTISLDGAKRGQWFDFATQESGDHVELFARGHGLSARTDFRRVLELAMQWLGQTQVSTEFTAQPAGTRATKPRTASANEAPELGAPTAKWDYLAADGILIACVYRFEPAPGKKQFRPWNVATGKFEGLDPRPLYNLPGVARSESVVLVEGEKCAQALIDIGICATTAMHGAKAPVDKTDWSPLAGKSVLIWPDKDKPGWDYAAAASEAITASGARTVALLVPPADKPESWDCADAISESFDVSGFIDAGARMPMSEDPEFDPLEGIDWRTEDGLALGFTKGFGQDWRYCAMWGKWFGWSGGRWNEDRTLFVLNLLRRLTRYATRYANSAKLKAKLASAASVSALERLARNDPIHATVPEQFDADPWLLNTPKGIIDLATGQTLAHQREKLMTRMATATPAGDAPRWRAFLPMSLATIWRCSSICSASWVTA